MNTGNMDGRIPVEQSKKIIAPAAQNNKEPILEVLKQLFNENKKHTILEIGSGTGQHAYHFSSNMKNVQWIPSEYDNSSFESIQAYVEELTNVSPPMQLNMLDPEWSKLLDPQINLTAVFNANVIHIAPWEVCLGIFKGCGNLLASGGLLVFYGPFIIDGHVTTESNLKFDQSLKSRNPEWGIRNDIKMNEVAEQEGFTFYQKFDMPHNNNILCWKKN